MRTLLHPPRLLPELPHELPHELMEVTIQLLPTLLLALLYTVCVRSRSHPLGRELHFGFGLALTILTAISLYGLSTRQSGMLGDLESMLWSLVALPAAAIAFVVGWSLGVLLGAVERRRSPRSSDHDPKPSSPGKVWVASLVVATTLLAVPTDYLVRRKTPRWVGTSSTGAVASEWMGLTMRALYPYDRGDQYVPLFTVLMPPQDYRLINAPIGRPDRNQNGQLIFEFGPEIPPLVVPPGYSAVELREGTWVHYEGALADPQLQRFLRTPLPDHSLKALKRWIESENEQPAAEP